MTYSPAQRTDLAAFVANQRERIEAMRALALARGLPTAPLDELLFSVIALQREVTGEALAVIPPDAGGRPLS